MDSNELMSFKVNYNNLLKKYTKIWKKITLHKKFSMKDFFTYTKEILNGILYFLCSVSILMDIELDSEPTYGDNDNTYRPK